tara:strand:- start:6108 stop:6518 length:411 start_codon:yes stop_codon:yes gene_type:complete
MPKTYHYKRKIDEMLLDTFGHVNHANYLSLCEQARWEILNAYELGIPYIKKSNTGPVVLKVEVQYKNELKAGDMIEIHTHFQRRNEKLFDIYHTIVKQDKSVAAELVVLAAFWDTNKRKIIRPEGDWLQLFHESKA